MSITTKKRGQTGRPPCLTSDQIKPCEDMMATESSYRNDTAERNSGEANTFRSVGEVAATMVDAFGASAYCDGCNLPTDPDDLQETDSGHEMCRFCFGVVCDFQEVMSGARDD